MCGKSVQPFRVPVLAIMLLAVLAFWLPSVTARAALPSAAVKPIGSVTVSQDETTLRVTIDGGGPLTYTALKQVDPLAIIIDIPEADVSKVAFKEINADPIKKITGAFYTGRSGNYSRIKIALRENAPYTVTRSDTGIVIALQRGPGSAVKEETVPSPGQGPEGVQKPDEGRDNPAGPVAGPRAGGLVGVTVDASTKNWAKVVISADGTLPKVKSFTLSDPFRLVVDVPGVKLLYPRKTISVRHALLKKIRMAQKGSGVRLVFDPKKGKAFSYSVDQAAEKITVLVGKPDSEESQTAGLRQAAGTIEAIDFEPLDQGRVRVTVKADRKLAYQVETVDKTAVLLRLRQAVLPKALSRPYDTSYFEGAVDAIVPRLSPSAKGAVDIIIKMREGVPYKAIEKDNLIQLEFESTTVAPKPERLAQMQKEPVPETQKPAREVQPALPAEFAELAKESASLAPPKEESPFGPDKVYTGQKISLDFQNADIHNVLRLLAEVSKLNIVAGEDVSGKVTLKLDKVPWDQALDVVLVSNGLGMARVGNVVRIAPRAKLAEEEKQRLEVQKQRTVLELLYTEYIQVNYGKADKLRDQIEKIKSERGSVAFDERTNKIIIKDTQAVVESAKALVASLDEPTRQVLIEARIVEATADFSRQLGIQWGSGSASNLFSKSGGEWSVSSQGRLGSNFAVNPGIPGSDALGALGFTFGRVGSAIINLDVRLLAMESDGKVHIVSSPKITTLDNKEAYIQQGSKVPYKKQTAEGTVSTDFVEATLKLTVIPHITPDNRINLNIVAKKDEPDWSRTVEGVPALTTREAKTELLINNGETVVIGGIIYEKETKGMAGIPGLSKIPVLGWLFKGEKDVTSRTELLIFLSANTIKID